MRLKKRKQLHPWASWLYSWSYSPICGRPSLLQGSPVDSCSTCYPPGPFLQSFLQLVSPQLVRLCGVILSQMEDWGICSCWANCKSICSCCKLWGSCLPISLAEWQPWPPACCLLPSVSRESNSWHMSRLLNGTWCLMCIASEVGKQETQKGHWLTGRIVPLLVEVTPPGFQ